MTSSAETASSEHEYGRPKDERSRNRYALALSARQLPRAPRRQRARQLNAIQHVVHTPRPFLARDRIEIEQRLLYDAEHRVQRIQGTEWVLVDELDLLAELGGGGLPASS